MKTNHINRVAMALLILGVTGCSRHAAVLSTATAPGQIVSQTDALYLDVPTHPTIAEQKALIGLREALCRVGLTVVENPARARWHLRLETETTTDAADKPYRLSFGKALLFGPAAGIGAGDPTARTRATLLLYRPGRDGQPDEPIWQGEARTTEKQAAVFGGDVYRALLDKLGKDFQGRSRLSQPDPEELAALGCKK